MVLAVIGGFAVLLFFALVGSFTFSGEFGAFPQLDLLSFDCGCSTGLPYSSSLPSLYGGVIFVRNHPGMLFSMDPSDSYPSSTSSLTLSSTFPSNSILIEDGSKSRIRGSMSFSSTMTLDFPYSLEVDGTELTPERVSSLHRIVCLLHLILELQHFHDSGGGGSILQ
jgi:hypothetical protein